jgi:probable rRNA maturation factor
MVIFRKTISGVSELSLTRFVNRARRAAGMQGQVTVLVTSSAEVRDLNRRFRRKNKATDVLSFPAAPIEGDDNEGDIAISADIASENAERFGHPTAAELKVLTLHGILHLAGYDHETDNGKMARKEARLRRELHLPDALIERTENGTSATGYRLSAVGRRPKAGSQQPLITKEGKADNRNRAAGKKRKTGKPGRASGRR